MTPPERKAALLAIVNAAEGLARDVDQNPAAFPYTPNAKSLIRRLQGTADDLLAEAVAEGWLSKGDAANALFEARHGLPAAERARRDRQPR